MTLTEQIIRKHFKREQMEFRQTKTRHGGLKCAVTETKLPEGEIKWTLFSGKRSHDTIYTHFAAEIGDLIFKELTTNNRASEKYGFKTFEACVERSDFGNRKVVNLSKSAKEVKPEYTAQQMNQAKEIFPALVGLSRALARNNNTLEVIELLDLIGSSSFKTIKSALLKLAQEKHNTTISIIITSNIQLSNI